MKKLIVAAIAITTVLAASAALAAPAGAVKAEITGIQRGDILEGGISFQARASSAAGIKKVEISINGATVASMQPSNFRQEVTLPYDWPTMFKNDSAELAPNGEYTIKARAVAYGDANEEFLARVIVDNPAATPSGLAATPNHDSIELTWNPNPEPDLLGYQIERSTGGDFAVVAETTDTSFIDMVQPGDYSYRIIAVRNSAARTSGRPSLPSEETTVRLAASPTDANGKPRFGVGVPPPSGSASRGFRVKDAPFAARGLPSGAALPGSTGLPSLPRAEAPTAEWGSYEETLPYDLPEGGIPLSASRSDTMSETWTVLPSDGLRWVAMGSLLLALAALLRLVARRLETLAGPSELKL